MSARHAATAALLAAATAVLLSACGTDPISGSFSPVANTASSDPALPAPAPAAGPAAGSASVGDPAPAAGPVPVGDPAPVPDPAPAGDPAPVPTPTPSGGDGGHSDHDHDSGHGDDPHAPAVRSFSASKPTCRSGDTSVDLKLRWTVTGADNATIEIAPGDAIAVRPSGSTTVGFPCDGAAHTYSVWPGGHQDVRTALTVTAKIEKTSTAEPHPDDPATDGPTAGPSDGAEPQS